MFFANLPLPIFGCTDKSLLWSPVHPLKLTNIAPELWAILKGNDRIPTIHFQGRTVKLREGIFQFGHNFLLYKPMQIVNTFWFNQLENYLIFLTFKKASKKLQDGGGAFNRGTSPNRKPTSYMTWTNEFTNKSPRPEKRCLEDWKDLPILQVRPDLQGFFAFTCCEF